MSEELNRIYEHIQSGKSLWLFLDYDGTLAEFAPTPDTVTPDQAIIDLIKKVSKHPQVLVAVVTGRSLNQIRLLIPVPGIILAGTYGIEMLLSSGEELSRVEYNSIRPVIEKIKPRWENLIHDLDGFYLEDKGSALAIHARLAKEPEATDILLQARQIVKDSDSEQIFQMVGGYKFVEISPILANKGETVRFIIDRFAKSDDLFIYLGDDFHDEHAFEAILEKGGIPIHVGPNLEKTSAKLHLDSPTKAIEWVQELSIWLYNKKDK